MMLMLKMWIKEHPLNRNCNSETTKWKWPNQPWKGRILSCAFLLAVAKPEWPFTLPKTTWIGREKPRSMGKL